MPQFDFNSNKFLIFVFCLLFFVFVYFFLIVFNTVIKFVNFNKFYVLNIDKFNSFSNKLIFMYSLDQEIIFNNINITNLND